MEETKNMETGSIIESELGTKPIKKLYMKYWLASFFGMIAQMTCGIADGFFVGNGVGPLGLGAISIVFPWWIIAISIGNLIGVGASSIAAVNLGKGDVEAARKASGQSFWYGLILSSTITLLVLANVDSVVRFMGATNEIVPVATSYMMAFMPAFPLYVCGFVFFFFIRVDEKPFIGTVIQIVPAILAVIVEYVMIFKMGAGIAGSAIGAWGICVGAFSLLGLNFVFGNSKLKIKWSDINLDFKLIGEMNKIGFAAFAIQICATVMAIIINNTLAKLGGSAEIAAYGIINAYIVYVLSSIAATFMYGILPITGYNFGSKAFDRVREALMFCLKLSFSILYALTIAIYVFKEQILMFFTGGDPALMSVTSEAMKVFLVLYPLGAMSMIISGYFQSVEASMKALVNGVTRNFLIVVPLLIILPKTFGIQGVWIAQPLSDFIAFAIAAVYVYKEVIGLKKLES